MAVVDKNKLLGKSEKGGDLMVRPTTSLVGSPGGKITKTSDEKDVVYTIQTKLISVDKLLKGTLASEKAQNKKEKKQKEDEVRAEQEADKEKPDDKKQEKETPKSLIPKMSFLDGIKKCLGDVLMGWLVFRLIEFLPKIVSFLKPAAAFVDFLINFGGKLLDGLVTFVDWGYKVVKGTEEWIGDVFGEGAAEKFKNFSETFTKFLNLALIAAMIGAKGGMLGLGGPGKRGIVNTAKRVGKRVSRFFDPKRAAKLKRLKNIKKIRADKLLRLKKFKRLKKFAKAKKLVGKGINLGKNIVKSPVVKNIVKKATPVIKTATKTATKVAQTATKGVKTAVKTAKTATKTATKLAKTATKTATTAAKTAAKTGTKLAKTGLKTGLKGLKSLQKIVSPIVKKIPFIGALLDFALNYFVFKEPLGKSAFMAIGAGVGAWLGGILGTLIPVPFVGSAIGAFVGGAGGDMLAGALYDAIFKDKKPKESDKKEEKEKGDTPTSKEKELFKLEQRKLEIIDGTNWSSTKEMENDPEYIAIEKEIADFHAGKYNVKGNAENIIPLDVNSVSKKASNVSSSASYEEGAEETIVIKSGSEGDDTVETETQGSAEPILVGTGGGGGDDEVSDALYKSG